ncbi:cobalamin biosynthesis protein CobW [Paenibacillus sp. CAA11]|uniref:GTP-binding protein n=1 Tax=Paenibacillus sp. CAA11 TaxID=1532905 RepID=UPI000D37FC01|nr:GTP-binding protein [Paenibacillus sp. CAA11]AWB44488.1 cobalamin biosynthesis protein CobW [Paenibacillus sp. CAA11]
MEKSKIPVTVLSGYLGSGKTTVLNHVLRNRQGLKVAVIVNDMSEINIDAGLVRGEAMLSRTEERLVEMSNGCICCTLREDLIQEVAALAKEGRFDYILIESTGISEPIPIAQTFSYIDESTGIHLGETSRLDCLVTVVDAYRFWHDLASGQSLVDRGEASKKEDTRDIVDLLIDQIETCDVLLLNKCDLVEAEELSKLEGILRKLQPNAKLIRTIQGQVNPSEILNTGLFSFEKACMSPGWIQELQAEHHTPETDEYGIGSFVYRRRAPFHPERLSHFMDRWPEEIVRAKGLLWLAAEEDLAASISQAGPSIQFGPAGRWVASLPKAMQQEIIASEPDVLKRWDPKWGDRLNELVLIGIGYNQSQIENQLDACLLTEQELEQDWSQFRNPLPWIDSSEAADFQ